MKINQFKTIIFDCDGVILNSNKIKTEGFYEFAYFAGQNNANKLVEYHIQNGGISRFEKIKFLYKNLLNKKINDKEINLEVKRYSSLIKKKLFDCEVAPYIYNLREITPNCNWIVVSGSEENELKEVLNFKKLNHLFDNNIFGSPLNKIEIISREISNQTIKEPTLFIGDSEYDYKSALLYKMEFIYLAKWSEWSPDMKYSLNNAFFDIKELYEKIIRNDSNI